MCQYLPSIPESKIQNTTQTNNLFVLLSCCSAVVLGTYDICGSSQLEEALGEEKYELCDTINAEITELSHELEKLKAK